MKDDGFHSAWYHLDSKGYYFRKRERKRQERAEHDRKSMEQRIAPLADHTDDAPGLMMLCREIDRLSV